MVSGRNKSLSVCAKSIGVDRPVGLASLFEIGTYGSLNGKIHSGDGLQVHELIRHEYLK